MNRWLFLFIALQLQIYASVEDDLITAITNNSIPGVIAAVDEASLAAFSLNQMIGFGEGALSSTTATQFNNAARRYLTDFVERPFIDANGINVVYVDQDLFAPGQVGFGFSPLITTDNPPRVIFGTIQDAIDYINAGNHRASWSVIIDQAVYNENVTVPAGLVVTLKSVGGVILGDGLGDQFSSVGPTGILSWDLNDNLSFCDITPSLTVQAIPFGGAEFKNFCYIFSFLLGGADSVAALHTIPAIPPMPGGEMGFGFPTNLPSFHTNITGPVTLKPQLEFDGVYAYNGINSADPGSPDIGPIVMTIRNLRSGGPVGATGVVSNWASANVVDIENSNIVGGVNCKELGNVTSTALYTPWTVGATNPNSIILDTQFRNVFGSPFFTVTGGSKTFTLNYSSAYWFNTTGCMPGPGTTKSVQNQ